MLGNLRNDPPPTLHLPSTYPPPTLHLPSTYPPLIRFGTLEELLEVITWQTLGLHRKPVALLNTAGFYDPLLSFFDSASSEGFISQEYVQVSLQCSFARATLR